MPAIARDLVDKVYSTYFPSRGDHEWSRSHPDQRVNQYLMSTRTTAWSSEPLEIDVMDGYFTQQFAPDTECDLGKYWKVIDRTTGEILSGSAWSVRKAPARLACIGTPVRCCSWLRRHARGRQSSNL